MTVRPSAIDRIKRYGGVPRGPLRLALRMQATGEEQTVRYDAWIIDGDGRVVLAMERCEGAMNAALNRLADKATPRG